MVAYNMEKSESKNNIDVPEISNNDNTILPSSLNLEKSDMKSDMNSDMNSDMKSDLKSDTIMDYKPTTLSSILDKHNMVDNKSLEQASSLNKLSTLLKSSGEKEVYPYTNYIIGGSIFLIICFGLYYVYLYFIENRIFTKINNLFNPPQTNDKNEKKKVNYKKEGFENNIKGLEKVINSDVNKNALNKQVNFFDSDSDIKEKISDDEASSNTQIGLTKNKHCYIGTDRGFRSCIEIGDADKCMSGDIFPSQDICINPSLRQ